MADELDRAQAASEVYERAAMQAHKAAGVARHAPGCARQEACLDCGKPIPLARLKAYPAATRCVPCQEINERGGLSAR